MTAQLVTIRPASATDEPTIYNFLCDLENQSLDQSAFDAIFARNLATPTIYYRVAEQVGEVIGFISCHLHYLLHHTGLVGEIQELYVRPDYRNLQVGRQLVAALEAELAPIGLVGLEVTTNRQRADAIRFYESQAFRPTHIKLVKQCPA
jgi:PhnO protein